MAFAQIRALGARTGLLLLLVILNTTVLFADSVITKERTVTKVAEGVYVIRHKDAPDTFPQGNTTVIIGDREVLVVDSCYLPSSAREDIAQIRQWTNKPVRYLLNTHWHYDHTLGNGAYADAFPQLMIVAHTETRKQSEGYNPGYLSKYNDRIARFKRYAETGKGVDGKPLTEAQIAEFREAAAGGKQVSEEFRNLVDRLPNLMFDEGFDIDLGNREAQVKHLGRGNTAGDTIVYLPKEKILIAGDLLDHPVPYLGGGYPSELITTLQSMGRMDTQTIIPGHGEVLRGDYGKVYLNQVIDFLKTVVAEVSLQVYRIGNGPRNLEAVREATHKAIDMNAWRQKFAGDDKDNREFFDGFSLPGLVTAAYAEVWGR
jgi:cyclase